MEQAIQLFGFLILAVLGLAVPIMVILLSVFQEGISKLATQYEAERVQSEANIKEQLKKLAQKGATTDEAAIERNLKELKAIKKAAAEKLSYLNPKQQIRRLFAPLIIAFSVVASSFLVKPDIQYLLLLIGIAVFIYAIVVLVKSISVIVQVKKIIDADKRDADAGTVALLSEIAQKVGKEAESYYLQNVCIIVNDKKFRGKQIETITVPVNTKYELKVGMANHENRMAKKVEVGLIFPVSFMVDKGEYTIYRGEGEQIARYETDYIQGNTTLLFPDPLKITPLEQGDHKIKSFIKAENIKSAYVDFIIRVTE